MKELLTLLLFFFQADVSLCLSHLEQLLTSLEWVYYGVSESQRSSNDMYVDDHPRKNI